MKQHTNFEDGYWSSYSIIGKEPQLPSQKDYRNSRLILGNKYLELIPSVTDPKVCQGICELVEDCTHWTLDTDDRGCYLVDSPEALEYSDDKISGPKSCEPER